MIKTIQEDKKDMNKEYIITYQSEEHYEVLGYVKADSLAKAKALAEKKLFDEAQYYNVTEAEIDEIAEHDIMNFKIKEA
ncbi:MAG: hypothetical protein NTX26_00605 [Candidatus Parcubacteria bacterium]|nr:hypothetical protein [Candidatus Parcubacteria bacterium]